MLYVSCTQKGINEMLEVNLTDIFKFILVLSVFRS